MKSTVSQNLSSQQSYLIGGKVSHIQEVFDQEGLSPTWKSIGSLPSNEQFQISYATGNSFDSMKFSSNQMDPTNPPQTASFPANKTSFSQQFSSKLQDSTQPPPASNNNTIQTPQNPLLNINDQQFQTKQMVTTTTVSQSSTSTYHLKQNMNNDNYKSSNVNPDNALLPSSQTPNRPTNPLEQSSILTDRILQEERQAFDQQLKALQQQSTDLFQHAIGYAHTTKEKDNDLDRQLEIQRKDLEEFRKRFLEIQRQETSNNQIRRRSPSPHPLSISQSDLKKLLNKIDNLQTEIKKLSPEKQQPQLQQEDSPASPPQAQSFRAKTPNSSRTPTSSRSYKQSTNRTTKITQSSSNTIFMQSRSLKSPLPKKANNLSSSSPLKQQQNSSTNSSQRNLSSTKKNIQVNYNYHQQTSFNQSHSDRFMQPPSLDQKQQQQQLQKHQRSNSQSQSSIPLTELNQNNSQNYQIDQQQPNYASFSSSLITQTSNFFSPNKQLQPNYDQHSHLTPPFPSSFVQQQSKLHSSTAQDNFYHHQFQQKQQFDQQQYEKQPNYNNNNSNTKNNKNNNNNSDLSPNVRQFTENGKIEFQNTTFSNSPPPLSSQRFTQEQSNQPNQLPFLQLTNHVYLVQSKTVSSPILQLLGNDRFIVATPYKGELVKATSNRLITHGDIYQYRSRVSLVTNQVVAAVKSNILNSDPFETLTQNTYIIGPKSSHKKILQIDLLMLQKTIFYTKITELLANSYPSKFRIAYTESSSQQPINFDNNQINLPLHELDLEYNPSEPSEVIERKLDIFSQVFGLIAKEIENQPKLSSLNKYPNKVRAIKLSLTVFQVNDPNTLLCKQSYRIITSNKIVNSYRKNVRQVFVETFEVAPKDKAKSTSLSATLLSKSTLDIFKKDQNLIVFACAPLLKNHSDIQVFFKTAALFERYSRKLAQNSQMQPQE